MKKSILLVMCVLLASAAFGQSFYASLAEGNSVSFSSGDHEAVFKDGTFTLQRTYDDTILLSSSFTASNDGTFTWINLPDVGKKLLCLSDGTLLELYDGTSDKPLFSGSNLGRQSEALIYYSGRNFPSATSELKEGNRVYSAADLADLSLAKPWVEGADGPGIGESVTMYAFAQHLWIFSGYVSYDKPYLYNLNARPKTLKITDVASGDSYIFELADTPDPQYVEFDDRLSEIRIEIMDVYPGTRYQDTCINAIVGFVF